MRDIILYIVLVVLMGMVCRASYLVGVERGMGL